MSELARANRIVAGLCRMLPVGMKGKWRLGRWLLSSALDQEGVTLRHRCGKAITVPHLGEPIAFALLVDGVYEPDVEELLKSRLREGSVFVDVGANVGALAIPAAAACGRTGRVVAIEASPSVFAYLKANAGAADTGNISPINCAVSDSDAMMDFYDAPTDHFGMGSGAPQFGMPAKQVQGQRLDTILAHAGVDRVDVLKVDVEGFEADVFSGASEFLGRGRIGLVAFEFCDWAEERAGFKCGKAQEMLMDLGYAIWTLDDWNRSRPPAEKPVTSGFVTLVATRPDA